MNHDSIRLILLGCKILKGDKDLITSVGQATANPGQ